MFAVSVMAALFVATVYAPLFHVHADEANEAPLVHAHFPELESENERVMHVEAPHHSHGEARSIDFLTTTGAQFFQFDAIILSDHLDLEAGQTSSGFVTIDAPRAHAPPGVRSHIPRSPPPDVFAVV
jgi:hypothetical protein